MVKKLENVRKNSQYKARGWTFLFIMMFTLAQISMVSAIDWDNRKSFTKDETTSDYGKIKIKNWLGLGADLADLELKENTNTCISTCEAYTEIKTYGDYALIKDIRFIDLDTNKQTAIESYEIYYSSSSSTVQVSIFDYVTTGKYGNGSNIINFQETSTQNVKQENWQPYTLGDILPEGVYQVKLVGKKNPTQNVDWQYKSQGIWLDEWAAWSAGLEVDLLHFWNFEEGGAAVVKDVFGTGVQQYNGSIVGTVDRRGSVKGEGMYLDGTHNYMNITNFSDFPSGTGNFTINLWVNNTAGGVFPVTWNSLYAGDEWAFYTSEDSNIYGYMDGGQKINSLSNVTFDGSTWSMLTWTKNTSHHAIYEDSTLMITTTTSGSINPANVIIGGKIGTGGANFTGMIDEIGLWNRSLTPTEISDLFNDGSPIGPDDNSISSTLVTPTNGFKTALTFQEFNSTQGSSGGIALANATTYLWYNNGSEANRSSIDITGSSNSSNFTFSGLGIGVYSWNTFICGTNAGTFCDWGNSNFTFTVGSTENNITWNATTTETKTEGFVMNITPVSGTPTNGVLTYNGTNYTATIASVGSDYIFTNSLTVPVVSGTKNFQWFWELGSDFESSTQKSQTVNQFEFGLCNASLTTPFINITFTNETVAAEPNVTATIDSSTWYYWIDDASVNKTFTYSDATENLAYAFCGIPNTTINVFADIDYNNGGSQQRTFVNTYSLSNTTTEQTLFLLPTADGAFITFQVINIAEQQLSGVTATVKKGSDVVDKDVTDDAGSVTFFLNQDTSYSFTFEKTGFTNVTTTLVPSQTGYTITMGGGTSSGNFTIEDDYNDGIGRKIEPTYSIFNNTAYDFNFTITSTKWSLSEFGFTISNTTDLLATATPSVSSTGGTVNLNFDTSNHTKLILNAYWLINGNYTNVTEKFFVYTTGDTTYSVNNFFVNLKTHLDNEIFGLDNFGLAIILFFGIFITTGVMSFKFGLRSPEAISGFMFAFVAFLDVGLKMMDSLNPMNSLPHFPTIFVGFIFVILVIRGVRN